MRLGLANGCFDRFHDGHRHYLNEAKRQCDYLIAAVNSDASVKRLKGQTRPFDSLHKRLQNVHLYAHAAIPFEGNVDTLIMQIRPHVLFKGYDHSVTDFLAMRQVGWKEHGLWDRVDVVQIGELPGYSTTGSVDETQLDA